MQIINQNKKGFTLIEMLVSLVILSIGMLGLAALQMRAFQDSQDAYLYSQSTFQAYDLSDRIRANPDFWRALVTQNPTSVAAGTAQLNAAKAAAAADSNADHENCSFDDAINVNTIGCSPTQLAIYDLYRWNADSTATLPGLAWTLTMGADPNDNTEMILIVNLSWDVAYSGSGITRPSFSVNVRP